MDLQTKKLYKLKAEIIAAAGHPIRLAIIDFLKNGEQCVCDIVKNVDAQRSNVSRHLALLLKAGLLEQRKEGLKMIYSLKTPCILNFLKCVEGVLVEKAKESAAMLKSL